MNLKKILILVVVVYGLISAWMIGTPFIKNAMFSNDLDNIARTLSVDGTVEKARNQVNEAVKLDKIPASPDNYVIIKNKTTRQVLIEVPYTVKVTTPFGLYTYVWNFKARAEKGLQKIPRPEE